MPDHAIQTGAASRAAKGKPRMAREMQKTSPALKSQSHPTQEQIARRAYEIFVQRGRPEGCDLDHWLEAEAQLNAEMAQAAGDTRASRGSRRQAEAQRR